MEYRIFVGGVGQLNSLARRGWAVLPGTVTWRVDSSEPGWNEVRCLLQRLVTTKIVDDPVLAGIGEYDEKEP